MLRCLQGKVGRVPSFRVGIGWGSIVVKVFQGSEAKYRQKERGCTDLCEATMDTPVRKSFHLALCS
jgi:hypothetical protein